MDTDNWNDISHIITLNDHFNESTISDIIVKLHEKKYIRIDKENLKQQVLTDILPLFIKAEKEYTVNVINAVGLINLAPQIRTKINEMQNISFLLKTPDFIDSVIEECNKKITIVDSQKGNYCVIA
jgi:hypothetical protein